MQKHRFNVRLGSLLWSAERWKSWSGSDREGGMRKQLSVPVCTDGPAGEICSQMGLVSKAKVLDCV